MSDRLLGRGTVIIGLSMVVVTMTAFFRVPILPELGRDLSMSVPELGILTAVFAAGRLLVDIPGGRLADVIRPNFMMGMSALAVGLGSFVLGAAPSAGVGYGGGFLLGVGSALVNATGLTFFSTVSSLERRGAAVSIGSAGLLIGQSIGPTLGGVFAAFGGWRIAEVAAGIISFSFAIAVVRFGRLPAPIRREPLAPQVPGDDGQPSITFRVRVVLYMVPFAMFISLGALIQTLIPVIGDAELDLSSSKIGLALGAGGLARLIGAIVGGQVSDRVSRKSALVPGLLGQAAGIALLAAGPSRLIWMASILLMGLSSVGVAVSATILVDLSGGGRVGRELGRFRFVGDLGLMAGPAGAAWLFANHGTAAAVIPMAAVLTTTALAVALFLPETRWLQSGELSRE